MPEPDSHSLKLIETIYRTALDPDDYDAFMLRWDDWMETRMGALADLKAQDPAMSAPEIAAHFELALRLLERLGDRPSDTPRKGPQMLVDETGAILWQNAEADRTFGKCNGRDVRAFQISQPHRDGIQTFLDGLKSEANLMPRVVQIATSKSARPLAFRVETIREREGAPFALLSSLAPAWPPATDQLLSETHKLSASEIAICAQLVSGASPATISEQRETSLATVRTQIKKILSKTQTGTQAELVAHLHAIMRMAEGVVPAEPRSTLPARKDGKLLEFTLSGRRVRVEEHGSETGYPIIFVHGMLDGTGVTDHIRGGLEQHGLRLICPHRPGFGVSEPMREPIPEALHVVAQDICDLAKTMKLKRPILVGHMAGSLYTFAAAEKVKAAGIVNVSGGVPLISNAQFDAMTRRQRLVAYTALYAPSVLPFVINAGIRQIKNGGIEKFMQSLYEHAPVDGAVLENEHVRALVMNGYEFTVAQGHMAFATDSHHVVRDWTMMFKRSAPTKVHLVHGAHDPVVDIASVRDFARRNDERVKLTEVSDAGQLVFYQSPGIVLRAIADMI